MRPDLTPSISGPDNSVALALLARCGVSPEGLRETVRLADRWGVTCFDACLAAGWVGEEALYAAVAAETGAGFLRRGEVVVHPQARPAPALATGLVPLASCAGPGAFAYAPRGERLAGLVCAGRLSPDVRLATPTALREGVFEARGEVVARLAAESLPRDRPDDSFLGGPTLGQILAAMLLCLVSGLAVGSAGLAATVAALLLVSLPFLGLTAIRLAAVTVRAPTERPAGLRIADADLPVYTVLVPLHRERRVLPKLLAALSALDYPAAKLDAKLVVEDDDQETREALAGLRLPPFLEVIVAPPGAPRTKPRALNVALPLARGEFLVVFDAEDVPARRQLRDAVATFRRSPPDVACLQARLVIDNTADSLLTGLFTLEYGALFDVVNPALAAFDLPVPLGGTSNHLRTDVLRAVGGWDAWNVTEDADLAVRLASGGFRVADLPSATLEEAPARLRAWHAQRARWMKGFLQVSVTHSRRPIRLLGRLGLARLCGAAAIVAGTVLSALAYPILTAIALLELGSGRLLSGGDPIDLAIAGLALTLLAAGFLAMTVPVAVAAHRRRWTALWPLVLLMPAYAALISSAAWRGLYEFVTDPARWNKTEHGLARTSRAAGQELVKAASASRPPPAPAGGPG